jgi:hypothetical protein
VIAPNVQDIPVGQIAANLQDIPGNPFSANNQNLDNGAITANLQALPKDDGAANRQTLGEGGQAPNKQGIPTEASASNEQAFAKLGTQDNKQAIGQDSLAPNQQPLAPAPNIQPNNQAVGTDAPSLNRQAAPEDAPPGPNRQGLDNKNIESHFETLPSGSVERKKVDFGNEKVSAAGNTASNAGLRPSTNAVKKGFATARTPMTAAEQQEAKLKREQMNDAFHGRLAGIKHNVDALNNRLTDFEEKVQKEDVKLDKGNPDDFDVNLD